MQNPQKRFLLGWGPFVKSQHPQPNSLYHPDFFLDKKNPWLLPRQVVEMSPKAFSEFLSNKTSEKTKGLASNPVQNSNPSTIERFFKASKKPSFIQYQALFFQAYQAFQKGSLQKIVPCLREELGHLRPPLLSLLQNLFKNTFCQFNGFFYGAWNKESGILGFTPELLFSFKEQEFETQALAGTGLCFGPSLLKNKKELKEHDFVVKGITESLKWPIDGLKILQEEISFPPLKHLRTRLIGRFARNRDFIALCQALHPTPALGGVPKKAALRWLKNSPSQRDRGFFGAPFGFFRSPKEAFCVIALRALEWSGSNSWIRSGGGLIAESLLQKEWRELTLKREQVKRFFSPPFF